jgi:uncharacterized protein YciI
VTVRYLAVTMVHGPAFDESRGLREQDAWDEHAVFMDELVEEGLIVMGGPLGDGHAALLIFDTDSEDEVRRRMAADPWEELDILRVGSVEPWQIWLDGR